MAVEKTLLLPTYNYLPKNHLKLNDKIKLKKFFMAPLTKLIYYEKLLRPDKKSDHLENFHRDDVIFRHVDIFQKL